eukprot:359328-Chlamydomonas_euryale.AAC.14
MTSGRIAAVAAARGAAGTGVGGAVTLDRGRGRRASVSVAPAHFSAAVISLPHFVAMFIGLETAGRSGVECSAWQPPLHAGQKGLGHACAMSVPLLAL